MSLEKGGNGVEGGRNSSIYFRLNRCTLPPSTNWHPSMQFEGGTSGVREWGGSWPHRGEKFKTSRPVAAIAGTDCKESGPRVLGCSLAQRESIPRKRLHGGSCTGEGVKKSGRGGGGKMRNRLVGSSGEGKMMPWDGRIRAGIGKKGEEEGGKA